MEGEILFRYYFLASCLFAEKTNIIIVDIHPSNIRLDFRRGQSSLFELPNKDFDKCMQKRGTYRNSLIYKLNSNGLLRVIGLSLMTEALW